MDATQRTQSFVSIEHAAYRLGIPIAWLRREAARGDIPTLRVGRRILLNPPDVERALRCRSRGDKEGAETVRDGESAPSPGGLCNAPRDEVVKT